MEKSSAAIVVWMSLVGAQSPTSIDLWDLIGRFGLPTVLVVMLLIGWWKKDQRATQRAELQQDFITSKLLDLAEDSNASNKEVASSIRGLTVGLSHVAEVIRECPGGQLAAKAMAERQHE